MEVRTYKWDFFLAHAGGDVSTAEKLYELLTPYQVFLDSRSLLPGDDWDQELSIAQSQAMITIVLVSSNTDNAYYQREEIAAAISMAREDKTKHRVVPVFLDDTSTSANKVPYGLRLKHGLYVSHEGGLAAIAERLRELFDRTSKSALRSERSNIKSLKFEQSILDAMTRLGDEDLTSEVIIPLVEILHPGKIEYSSHVNSAKRLLVSSGVASLKRPHLLCVQVKPIANSVDDAEFEGAVSTIKSAKSDGLTRENGQHIIPNEAWLITPFRFSDESRRRLSEVLQELSRHNIHFISGEELCSLITENIPDVATTLAKYSTPEIITLISALSRHNEGRAFGFSTDKNINDYYVTTSLSPYATRAYAAIRDEISVTDYELSEGIPIGKLLNATDAVKESKLLESVLKGKAIQWITKGILSQFQVDINVHFHEDINDVKQIYIEHSRLSVDDLIQPARFGVKLRDGTDQLSLYLRAHLSPTTQSLLASYSVNKGVDAKLLIGLVNDINDLIEASSLYDEERFSKVRLSAEAKDLIESDINREHLIILNRVLLEDAYPKVIGKNQYLKEKVGADFTFKFANALKTLVNDTQDAIKNCPAVLPEKVAPVRRAWDSLEHTEKFIRVIGNQFKVPIYFNPSNEEEVDKNPVRIRVPEASHILNLDKIILVEGPPGCGKTTLLKVLAIDVLSRGRNVIYLPCFNISPNSKRDSLETVLEKFAEGVSQITSTYKKSILIIDGLDEAPFDLSHLILSSRRNFAKIVASTRIAFDTILRSELFRVELAPFTNEDRDLFFEKWFNSDPELMKQVKELVSKYPDIDNHTRLPLIATITVALLKNGIVPKTRAEIYEYRLDLLLSKWDRLRGVRRLYVDNPDAKRRFLRLLAYRLHSSENRRRNIADNELKDIYEEALGGWGYNVSYDHVMKDLVVGSGVLIEERPKVFSFGHLTFQEHLAGEHISKRFSVEEIAALLDDDWWREPLNFYASIQGDITELLEYMMEDVTYLAHAEQLAEMAMYAPYTSPGAIETLEDSLKTRPKDDLDKSIPTYY
jgi:SpoVK/Ycf46/Vps4 family AAA+-type ATPase